MKKIIIKNIESMVEDKDINTRTGNSLVIMGEDDLEVSDGFHTIDELYTHRIVLFIALAKMYNQQIKDFAMDNKIWRSEKHSDGTGYENWFILGINKENGKQITYHLPMSYWEDTKFADTLDKAPEFDGHSSQDVLERLKKL